MEADQVGRLHDILQAAQLIQSYIKDTAETDFLSDKQKQDAVIRRFEIIGEAAAHLSNATRRAVPQLPFRKMRGMRNIVAHDYANVEKRLLSGQTMLFTPRTALNRGVALGTRRPALIFTQPVGNRPCAYL